MNVVFTHSEVAAANIRTFWFKPEQPVQYVAGQFIELYLPHDNPDERGIRRWFTLSSSPTEPLLAITTKLAVQGTSLYSGSSFKKALSDLQPGARVNMADPMGDFVLPKDPAIPLVFVAGGIGITPVRSMVKWLLGTGEKRKIHLIYAASNLDELAFESLLKRYGLKLTVIIKEPPTDYKGQAGSLDANRILNLTNPTGQTLIYLSGPEPMIETFVKDLEAKGINKHQLVTDYFLGYGS